MHTRPLSEALGKALAFAIISAALWCVVLLFAWMVAALTGAGVLRVFAIIALFIVVSTGLILHYEAGREGES